MTAQNPSSLPANQVIQLLILTNKLTLKTSIVESRQALIFTILNDTVHVLPYERAVLWDISKNKPSLLGVSGESSVKNDTEIAVSWAELIADLKNPSQLQLISKDSFNTLSEKWEDYSKQSTPTVLWAPIEYKGKNNLGLWLERWNVSGKDAFPQNQVDLLTNFLLPAYGNNWHRFESSFFSGKIRWSSRPAAWISFGLIALLFVVRVPLRVAAPCEVVPSDPYLITAPLEGIIAQINIEPGDKVEKGDVLFNYDKRVPIQQLKTAEKELEILQAEINRASLGGLKDTRSLAELSVLKLKLEKEKINLSLARYNSSQLTVESPLKGVAMIENPDEWRGKPVKVGEKIMVISDPAKTKIKIWIPENDNVELDESKPIKIFLNVEPERSWSAKIRYIAFQSTLDIQGVPSFQAEADWIEEPPGVKLGLKGSSVIYGEKVSLFYFLARKPWSAFRRLTGF